LTTDCRPICGSITFGSLSSVQGTEVILAAPERSGNSFCRIYLVLPNKAPEAIAYLAAQEARAIDCRPGAAFSVLLSHLVHTQLSAHLRYSSMYGGEILERTRCPSGYVENIQLALRSMRLKDAN
jgi:hypothetical protein